MTREEMLDGLYEIKNWKCNGDAKTHEIVTEVIKALEQESILDKIRSEIEQLSTKTRTNWDGCCPDIDYPEIEYVDVSKKKLLSIIDKYRAESENRE